MALSKYDAGVVIAYVIYAVRLTRYDIVAQNKGT